MKKIYYAILFSSVLVASCSNGEGEKSNTEPVSTTQALEGKEALVSKIESLELLLKKNELDATAIPLKVKELTGLYQEYAKAYPQDSISVDYLFKASDLAMAFQRFPLTVQIFDSILAKYPEFEKTPDVMYLKATVLDIDMEKKKEAKVAYNALIERYPDHVYSQSAKERLADSVAFELSGIELIKYFEEKNKQK